MAIDKFLLVVGLIALILAGGLVLAGCEDDKSNCPGGQGAYGADPGECIINVNTGVAKTCGNTGCRVFAAGQTGDWDSISSSVKCDC